MAKSNDVAKIFKASRECRERVGAKPFKKMTGSQKKKFDACLTERRGSLSGAGRKSYGKKKKR